MIRDWSNTVNEEMQEESTTQLDNLMEVIDADNMAGGDNPIDLDQNVSTPSEGYRKRPSDEPFDKLRNGEPEEALKLGDREDLKGNNLQVPTETIALPTTNSNPRAVNTWKNLELRPPTIV